MKKTFFNLRSICCCALLAHGAAQTSLAAQSKPAPVSWNEIGAKAGADYREAGLTVSRTESGATLHCVLQRLDGNATSQGLWLTSDVSNTYADRFRVMAIEVGRETSKEGENGKFGVSQGLADSGNVLVEGQTVRFLRPGLIEEYSVSMNGVRQDFILEQAPPGIGDGELKVTLEVTGARVQKTSYGACLELKHSGRRIAYSRLRVIDATGRQLPIQVEIPRAKDEDVAGEGAEKHSTDESEGLTLVINDAEAVFPVRIDPTFSDANWITFGVYPGVDGEIFGSALGTNGDLYVGGNFGRAGGVIANDVAKWDGITWSPLGSGILGEVDCMLSDGSGNLYVGGSFTSAGGITASNIAKWDGHNWLGLGSGLNNYVTALAIDPSGNIYAGGIFTTAGGNSANSVAKWNGTSWSALGAGITDEFVDSSIIYSLAFDAYGNLFAGGNFYTSNGAASIAKWDGNVWSSVGGEASDVRSLIFDKAGNLYAGGSFYTNGGGLWDGVYRWNGSTWLPLGAPVGFVDALTFDRFGNLFAGGNFAGGSVLNATNIAMWNGVTWTGLGPGLYTSSVTSGGSVYSFVFDKSGNLIVSGFFAQAGGLGAESVAKWDYTNWATLGSGPNGGVTSMVCDHLGNLYIGGGFTTIGGKIANHVAEWDGNTWLPLGSGIDSYPLGNTISSLVLDSHNNLYVGGSFPSAGGVTANNLARWDGESWSSLGSGTPGTVTAMVCDTSDNIFVGGTFNTVGGLNATNVAMWNGTHWSPLASGLNSAVNSLAFDMNGNLYAGGNFFFDEGENLIIAPVAEWNQGRWFPIGADEIAGTVYTIAADHFGNIYAGGDGLYANGIDDCVAKWDGNTWSPLGSGMGSGDIGYSAVVFALVCDVSGNLYAGGDFVSAGAPASYIALWDGNTWSSLGSGMEDSAIDSGVDYVAETVIGALALDGYGSLYAGGGFAKAGTNVSSYIAQALLAGTTSLGSLQVTINPVGAASAGAQWQVDGGLLQNSGATVSDLSVGDHIVAFSTISGWTRPNNQTISIVAKSTITATGTYVAAPTIMFTASPTNGSSPLTVQFSSPSLDSGGNTIAQWNWSFGDGSSGTNQNPSHVYVEGGTYEPVLIAINSFGNIIYGHGPSIVISYSCTSPPAGILDWWPADGSAADIIGQNHGVLENGATFAQGEVGLAFSFSAPNSYVALPTNFFPFPTTGTGKQPFTFETWFQTSSGGVIFGQQKSAPFASLTGGFVPGLYVGTDGYLYAELFWGGSISQLTSPTTVNNGFFHHTAVSYDGTNEILYVDGNSVGTNQQTQTFYASTYYYQLGTGYMGSWPAGNGGWYQFAGLIDEPALYSRALSPNEVAAIYNAGSSGKCLPPIPQPTFDTSATGLQWTTSGIRLTLTGLTGQGSLVIYTSTNLTTWIPIFTNAPVVGSIQYFDSSGTNSHARFYRAALLP